jgi:hypothetical protein
MEVIDDKSSIWQRKLEMINLPLLKKFNMQKEIL